MSNGSKAGRDNRSNQMNPNNAAYQSSRQGSGTSKPALDNRSNQMNPTHAPTEDGATPDASDTGLDPS